MGPLPVPLGLSADPVFDAAPSSGEGAVQQTVAVLYLAAGHRAAAAACRGAGSPGEDRDGGAKGRSLPVPSGGGSGGYGGKDIGGDRAGIQRFAEAMGGGQGKPLGGLAGGSAGAADPEGDRLSELPALSPGRVEAGGGPRAAGSGGKGRGRDRCEAACGAVCEPSGGFTHAAGCMEALCGIANG